MIKNRTEVFLKKIYYRIFDSALHEKRFKIIVPYRNREEHLNIFINYVSTFLNLSQSDILVVLQSDDKPFNRGKLLNIGFHLCNTDSDYFIFHDVDMLPQGKSDYVYPFCPKRLISGTISGKDIQNFPKSYFGGVVGFNKKDFKKVNGFSNEYWGWGCEDNDLLVRLDYFGLKCDYGNTLYKTLNHEPNNSAEYLNSDSYLRNVHRLSNKYDYSLDGLNSLDYQLVETVIKSGYTLYKVKI